MSLSNLISCIRRSSRQQNQRTTRRAKFLPQNDAQVLEQRTLLTNYLVEGTGHFSDAIDERADDSGALSAATLLAAIEHANLNVGADTIRFGDLFDEPQFIELIKPGADAGEEVVITDDLTIIGPGAEKLLISGNGFGANDANGNDFADLFEVAAGVNVTFFGVQLAGGFNGAVIRNEGSLILDHVHVTDSSSTAIQNFGDLHVQG